MTEQPSPSTEADEADMLLEGVHVLDFSQYLAGPSCTRLMVEQGASVIKVELPVHGDPARGLAPKKNRRSGFHAQQNLGKRSLCIDFRTEEGRAICLDLAAKADVIVENFTPGTMARYGLGYEELRAVNPSVIVVSISGFGQTGPLANRPCFDFIAQGYSGLMHMTGHEDGPPLFAGIAVADSNVGVHAFAAVGHALFRRERTGKGTHIDLSMIDALVHMHETSVHAPGMTDGEFEPMRKGRHYQPLAPAGVFRGPEGWIVLIVTANQITFLFDALGTPELADDPRFVGNPARLAHRDELTEMIESWMARFDTDDEVIAALDAHRVPCTKVNTPSDLASQPHLLERGTIRTLDDPVIGPMTVPGNPFHFSGVLQPDGLVADNLGGHNDEILGELGIGTDARADLAARGVVFSKPHG